MSTKIIRYGFLLAALYNFSWGLVMCLQPELFWSQVDLAPARYPFLVQGLGLFVALYGFGYYLVAANPDRYPVLVLIGLLGKSLGPLGWAGLVWQGDLPLRSMWINVTNDLMWLPLFVFYFFWLNGWTRPAQKNTYKQVLGSHYHKLPVVLRKFHNAEHGSQASGKFYIKRGTGRLARIAALAMGFQKDQNQCTIHLTVQPKRQYESWIRKFSNGPTMFTRQWSHNHCLYEAAGPFVFVFRLIPSSTGYRFEQQACLIRGLMMDIWPAMQIKANVRACPGGWYVKVQCHLAFIGRVITYGGKICFPVD